MVSDYFEPAEIETGKNYSIVGKVCNMLSCAGCGAVISGSALSWICMV